MGFEFIVGFFLGLLILKLIHFLWQQHKDTHARNQFVVLEFLVGFFLGLLILRLTGSLILVLALVAAYLSFKVWSMGKMEEFWR